MYTHSPFIYYFHIIYIFMDIIMEEEAFEINKFVKYKKMNQMSI